MEEAVPRIDYGSLMKGQIMRLQAKRREEEKPVQDSLAHPANIAMKDKINQKEGFHRRFGESFIIIYRPKDRMREREG